MALKRTTKKSEIQKLMYAYMLESEIQRAPFLVAIFVRQHHPGGIIFEGARPLSASTEESGEITYVLTNCDSRYMLPIATVKLSGIEYVETLG